MAPGRMESLDWVSLGPQSVTVLLLALTRIHFQQLQTTRFYIQFKSSASLEKNQEMSYVKPTVLSTLFWSWAYDISPPFPSALFSLALLLFEMIMFGTAINVYLVCLQMSGCIQIDAGKPTHNGGLMMMAPPKFIY